MISHSGTITSASTQVQEAAEGVSIVIAGVPIRFPFAPYPIQRLFMEKVIQCLNASYEDMVSGENDTGRCRHNALLESPTGTGKTMSMLCAAHAWQLHHRRRHPSRPCPRILFASRTHSQLVHCVRELKRTSYSPSVAVLGSREQLCVHDEISQLRGARMNNACNSACRTGRCTYHTALKTHTHTPSPSSSICSSNGNGNGNGSSGNIMDIEDLAVWGRQRGVCPYFFSRDMAQHADIVFLPYNYLVDPALRRRMGIDVAGCVLVFDEAHNLDQFCSDAASFDLSDVNIAQAVAEVDLALHRVEDRVEQLKEAPSCDSDDDDDGDDDDGDDNAGRRRKEHRREVEGRNQRRQRDLEDQHSLGSRLGQLKDALLDLDEHLDSLPIPTAGPNSRAQQQTGAAGLTQSGEYIFELFSYMGVNSLTFDDFCRTVDEVSQLLGTSSRSSSSSTTTTTSGTTGTHGLVGLQTLRNALTLIFDNGYTEEQISQSFKVHISHARRPLQLGREASQRFSQALEERERAPKDMGRQKVVSFWCFHPGLALSGMFESASSSSPMSLIFTSGTLSPMDSFPFEYGLQFPVRLENPHVIGPGQIEAITLGTGPTDVPLNSSFGNRGNDKYQREVGAVVLNMCRLIPDGLLVFFPSATIMRTMLQAWERAGPGSALSLMASIRQCKEVFVEPEKGTELQRRIAEYERCIIGHSGNSSAGTGGVGMRGRRNGAVFFAVCRGRVSEGLDFRDRRGRGVIVIGLPFPPKEDPKVKLKREYMDQAHRLHTLGNESAKHLDGQRWYVQECSRAVNQCIGRIIRHRDDFGIILLCDDRYARTNMADQISRWLHPYMRNADGFGQVIRSVAQFFRARQQLQQQQQSVQLQQQSVSPQHVGTALKGPQSSGSLAPTGAQMVQQSAPQQNGNSTRNGPHGSRKLAAIIVDADEDSREMTALRQPSIPSPPVLVHTQRPLSPSTISPPTQNSSSGLSSETTTVPASEAVPAITPGTETTSSSSSSSISHSNSSPSTPNTSPSAAAAAVQVFMTSVRSRLTAEEYDEFKTTLRVYREHQRTKQDTRSKVDNFKRLVRHMHRLFSGNRMDLRAEFARCGLPANARGNYERLMLHYDREETISPGVPPTDEVEKAREKNSQQEQEAGNKRDRVLDLVTGARVKRPRRSMSAAAEHHDHGTAPPANDHHHHHSQHHTSQTTTTTTVIDLDSDSDTEQTHTLQQEAEQRLVPECSVCRDPLNEPHTANCGHVCCHECWTTWLSNKLECPVCRAKVRIKQLKRIHFT